MSTAVAAEVPICFVDTETDGVHDGRKVWEIGAIRREPDGDETTYHAFVEIDLATADKFGLRVGGFYDRHPMGRFLSRLDRTPPSTTWPSACVTRDRAAIDIARITHGANIIGAVPSFDTEVLDRLLREQGLTSAWHYHLGDVENLAVGFLAGRGQPMPPPWSSSELTAALGVEPGADDEKHTALGDVRWAMRMYDAVMSGGPA